ncbi:MAG TPA: hypothetical protein VJ576_20820 [Rhodocyclaceae bacterium]|nr:hypothetical protein [Rhodocyclaceae bacterium]
MVEVIEHVLDSEMDDIIERIESAVRRGGVLITTTPNREDLDLNSAYCPACGSFPPLAACQGLQRRDAGHIAGTQEVRPVAGSRRRFVDGGRKIHEKHLVLLREVRFMKWLGPLHLLAAP